MRIIVYLESLVNNKLTKVEFGGIINSDSFSLLTRELKVLQKSFESLQTLLTKAFLTQPNNGHVQNSIKLNETSYLIYGETI